MNTTDTPKAIPIAAPGEGTIATRVAAGLGLRPTLLEEWHFLRLAIVYVRQSDPQQVLNHLESRERQYALVDLAAAMGWPRDRILLIDEDQGITGKTAERRTGFHRLLAEVTMDHVGVIFGIDMSRMARNNKDWHHLMELCAIFGTILADEDRIYDPRDAEDRLLLGFKGTISEYELVLMHNRLERGRLHKAKRGALILDVPCGYVKLPTGEVARDPDEQVQATVQLVFDQFDDLGSCRVCTAIWYAIRSAWGCASTADRDVVSWNGGCQLRACWAGCCIIRSTQGPIPGDVAASITSGRLRVPASSRCGRCRCRSGSSSSRIACRPISRGNGT